MDKYMSKQVFGQYTFVHSSLSEKDLAEQATIILWHPVLSIPMLETEWGYTLILQVDQFAQKPL
jgi:hypothetical protein